MVILITGASHTGKTNLAQKMLEKTKYPYLSQDHIKMGLIRSGNTDLTPEDDEKLTEYLWPITREIIKTAIENKQNLIIEGCYMPFDWKQDFECKYLSEIRFICIAFSREYIRKHLNDILQHACCIEERLEDSSCTEENLIRDNLYYITGCEKNRLSCTLIRENYEEEIQQAFSSFAES